MTLDIDLPDGWSLESDTQEFVAVNHDETVIIVIDPTRSAPWTVEILSRDGSAGYSPDRDDYRTVHQTRTEAVERAESLARSV
jgi:hypothetical protein